MPTKDWVGNTVAKLHICVVRHGGSMNTDLAYGRAAALENFLTDPAMLYPTAWGGDTFFVNVYYFKQKKGEIKQFNK
jgi:hypothetical protein